jgi:DNA integrity scanning protein DisA with diadenylate cyclase activity
MLVSLEIEERKNARKMETLIIFSPAADPLQPLLNNNQHSPSNILKEKIIQMFSLNFFIEFFFVKS